MSETMWRLGRLYAERVNVTPGMNVADGGSTASGYIPQSTYTAANRAMECATLGLEALALRSVLRSMAATRRSWAKPRPRAGRR